MSKKPKTPQPVPPSRKAKPSQKAIQQNKNMRWVGLAIIALVILAIVFLLQPKSSNALEISVPQAYQKYQAGTFFLDVRTQEEWDQSHIEGATLIPLNELQTRMGELPVDQDIVVYCRTGNRSLQAVNTLRSAGFSGSKSMVGGINSWQSVGYPVVSGNQ